MLDGVNDSYLACTKSPPRDVPKAMGLGLCAAPRNHDGPCQFEWADGYVQVEVGRGPTPREQGDRYRRIARRAMVVAVVCACINLVSVCFGLFRVLFP